MGQWKIAVIALALGLAVLAMGFAKWTSGRKRNAVRPYRLFAGVTAAMGLMLILFGGASLTALPTAPRLAAKAQSKTAIRFVAISSIDGRELAPKELYLYPDNQLGDATRVSIAPENGAYLLVPGGRYIINAKVEQEGKEGEWAATENREWRHFDLFMVEGAERVDLNTVSTYVSDKSPKNPNGRFLLFSLPLGSQ